jgi:hypothetical protein
MANRRTAEPGRQELERRQQGGMVMRFNAVVFVLLLVALAANVPATARMGAGIMVGEPTGVCLKKWFDEGTAIDMATGWSMTDGDFYLHADYLWHRIVEDPKIGGSVPLYFGIGGRLLVRGDGDDSELGLRIPVGLDFFLKDNRFDIFVEIAPILNIAPETELGLSGGVGARFYF